jgi:hypothetical protein
MYFKLLLNKTKIFILPLVQLDPPSIELRLPWDPPRFVSHSNSLFLLFLLFYYSRCSFILILGSFISLFFVPSFFFFVFVSYYIVYPCPSMHAIHVHAPFSSHIYYILFYFSKTCRQ